MAVKSVQASLWCRQSAEGRRAVGGNLGRACPDVACAAHLPRAEHAFRERIKRPRPGGGRSTNGSPRAAGCFLTGSSRTEDAFERARSNQLAGHEGIVGAGARRTSAILHGPDRSTANKHDDFLNVSGYPQSRAAADGGIASGCVRYTSALDGPAPGIDGGQTGLFRSEGEALGSGGRPATTDLQHSPAGFAGRKGSAMRLGGLGGRGNCHGAQGTSIRTGKLGRPAGPQPGRSEIDTNPPG